MSLSTQICNEVAYRNDSLGFDDPSRSLSRISLESSAILGSRRCDPERWGYGNTFARTLITALAVTIFLARLSKVGTTNITEFGTLLEEIRVWNKLKQMIYLNIQDKVNHSICEAVRDFNLGAPQPRTDVMCIKCNHSSVANFEIGWLGITFISHIDGTGECVSILHQNNISE